MKIRSVTTAVVQANFDYTLVRICSDDGVSGLGECFLAPGLTAMVRELGQLLIGGDPRKPNVLRSRLMAAISASGGSCGSGMAYNAVSGLDAALEDLHAKLIGVPVSDLFGGAYRDSVEVYVDLHAGAGLESLDSLLRYRTPFWLSPSGRTEVGKLMWEAEEPAATQTQAIIDRAKTAAAAGFRRMKFDLDVFLEPKEVTDRSLTHADMSAIHDRSVALRQALGDSVEIAFDCHWRFDIPTALRIAEAVRESRPMWLEDPVPPAPRSMAAVARNSPVPIATGENTYLLEGFEELLDADAVHIVTPDVQKAGGLREVLRIGDSAARRFVPMAPHCIASPVGLLAAAQVCAASSNAICVEFHGLDVPFWDELVVSDGPIIRDGRVQLPQRSGIGAELNLEVARRYSPPGEPFFDQGAVR